MDPICPLVVELPIGVSVALLQSIVGAHAQVIGTTLVCTSGKWSDALGKCAALPSVVNVAPGTLLPAPISLSSPASAGRIAPNWAWPSLRGVAFTLGTVRS